MATTDYHARTFLVLGRYVAQAGPRAHTLQKMADTCSVLIPRSSGDRYKPSDVERWLEGRRYLTLGTLFALLQALGVSPATFFGDLTSHE